MIYVFSWRTVDAVTWMLFSLQWSHNGRDGVKISSITIVYSTVYSGTEQRKYQSSASLAFLREIHRWPVNFLHKGPVTREILQFDDVIMFDLYFPRYCTTREINTKITAASAYKVRHSRLYIILYQTCHFRTHMMLMSTSWEAITWANVCRDLCHHMASLGYSEIRLSCLRAKLVSHKFCIPIKQKKNWIFYIIYYYTRIKSEQKITFIILKSDISSSKHIEASTHDQSCKVTLDFFPGAPLASNRAPENTQGSFDRYA